MRFGIFNVEGPGLEQGISMNNFELVLASNVLQATRYLGELARN